MATTSERWLDRAIDSAIGTVAPQWQLKRTRARIATDLVRRHYGYEAAAVGRRTQSWNKSPGDANSVNGFASLARLREVARDLVRNNPYAEAAVATIADHTVGWGIVAKPAQKNESLMAAWKAWAETTACDADGRHDLYGLQKLVMTSLVESGEVLVRRRNRLLSDGLPIPLQLQVLEADMLDAFKTQLLPNGGKIVQGVEFDALGARVAYWLFPSHPGSVLQTAGALFPASRRILATDIIHVFKAKRPGQVRAVTWFAPVIVRMKEFDEYEDATLMKQKIAACLAVMTTDIDGSAPALGTPDDTSTPALDSLEPGAVLNLPPGRSVEVVQPPPVTDYQPYCSVTLRAIATGLGVTYEDLTGDYTNLPFSAARMSRLRHWSRVDDWRWRLLIPQFCEPVWGWAMQAAAVMGIAPSSAPAASWTPPAMPMLDPDKEGLAIQRKVRSGIQSLSGALRELGYDPTEQLEEMAADNALLDQLGLKLDSDPRVMTQAGQLQGSVAAVGGGTGKNQ
jgi:lambda family phage portal protein